MDYQKHYDLLIKKAKSRILEGYIERHHIIPKCFGGSNEHENLVELTAREHFIAHLLLYKMQTEKRKRYQMLKACIMFKTRDGLINNSRLYETVRIESGKMQSKLFSGKNHPMYGTSRAGEDNPFYGKTHNEDTKKKLSEARDGMIVAKDINTGEKLWVTKEEFKSDKYVGITSGTTMTDETKRKISEAHKKKPILTCPHCGKQGRANMNRYHFDNCKMTQQDA